MDEKLTRRQFAAILIGSGAVALGGLSGCSGASNRVANEQELTSTESEAASDKTPELFDGSAPEPDYAGIGKTIELGIWENKPLQWRVLDESNGMKILLTEYIVLPSAIYNEESGANSTTWANCTTRKYLNSSFIDTVFSAEQKEAIGATKISTQNNPQYGTSGGASTEDKIFLLSIDEARNYFATDTDRIGYFKDGESDIDTGWWLRSPGEDSDRTAIVYIGGSIITQGISPRYNRCGLRPALWVSADFLSK